jgi:uncharacterized RDD family membrane protein YckC
MMARTNAGTTAEDSSIITSTQPPRAVDSPGASRAASLHTRAGGYVVDMVILSAIGMIAFLIAAFLLLLSTDFAQDIDASRGDMYLFASMWLTGGVGAWTALNLLLLVTRQQTGGQYVAGLRLARTDGARLTFRDAATWWFCLNPLLFSWPMAALAGIPAFIITAQSLDGDASLAGLRVGELLLAASFLVLILCAVMPLVALIGASIDPRNRTLHDRVAGTLVVPVQT